VIQNIHEGSECLVKAFLYDRNWALIAIHFYYFAVVISHHNYILTGVFQTGIICFHDCNSIIQRALMLLEY